LVFHLIHLQPLPAKARNISSTYKVAKGLSEALAIMRSMHVAIICSEIDDASRNVAQQLLTLVPWVQNSSGQVDWTYGDFQLLIIRERLIKQEELDQSLDADLLVFASRHQSERRKGPVFTAHFTGDAASASSVPTGKLARAAPRALKLVVETLTRLSRVEVLVEATHHGPCALDKPSFFVEIGSSKTEWTDKVLGATLARALLMLDTSSLGLPCPTAVGFGGPHYAVRHTDVLLTSDICFGHIFATYQLTRLTPEIIEEGFERSQAQFAYFDRKHMGADRGRIASIVNDLGHEVIRVSDINGRRELQWDIYLSVKRALRVSGWSPEGARINVSRSMRAVLESLTARKSHLRLVRLGLNPEIVRKARAVDANALKMLLESEEIVHLERKDGSIPAIFVQAERGAQNVLNSVLKGCVHMLRQRYDVECSQRLSKLYISERKFNARLARSLGVVNAADFAKLARGEPIEINGKVIKPEDVFTRVRKPLSIANADEFGQR
jgi:D-aminoacyl-tRNA deacylase